MGRKPMKRRLAIVLGFCCFAVGIFAFFHEKIVPDDEKVKITMDGRNFYTDNETIFYEDESIYIPYRKLEKLMGIVVTVQKTNEGEKMVFVKKENGKQKTITQEYRWGYLFLRFEEKSSGETIVRKDDNHSYPLRKERMIDFPYVMKLFGYHTKWEKNEERLEILLERLSKDKVVFDGYRIHGDIEKIGKTELDLFFLTNEEREKNGIKPLEYDVKLGEIAKVKAKEMHDEGYFGHDSPIRGPLSEMLNQYEIEYERAGENLAAGQKTAEEVVRGWMDSREHKENLLKETFAKVGFGYYKGPNQYKRYYVQILVD